MLDFLESGSIRSAIKFPSKIGPTRMRDLLGWGCGPLEKGYVQPYFPNETIRGSLV